MSKRTRKAPVERKAPTKRGKAALAKTVSISLIEEEEEPKYRTFESEGWLEGKAEIENWLNLKSVEIHANSVSTQDYEQKTVRANIKVMKGVHYYEVRLSENTNVKVGWALDTFTPRENDALGCDNDSWGWDCSRQKIYHNNPGCGNQYNSWSYSDTGKQYGEYCNVGDIIGCVLNLNDKTISYKKNKNDLGIAFRLPEFKSGAKFHPCFTLSSRAKISVMFGPAFSFDPKFVYGLNTQCTSTQASDMIDVFQKYQSIGLGDVKDSLSFDIMNQKGVLSLASDLGCKDEIDPHIFLLAWKMRSRKFCEFYDHEWNVMWSLESAFTLPQMITCIHKWIKELVDDEAMFKSFYLFVFDYLLSEKGGRATALEKNDAINGWNMLQSMTKKKWKYYPQWIEYWKTNDSKGVNRDCWKMIVTFMENQKGTCNNNNNNNNNNNKGNDDIVFDENDIWPISIEDFVDYLKK